MGTVREESEMSRYIDADELERKYMSADYMDNDTAYDVIAELDTAPHIDIVRCKECKYEPICSHSVQHTTHEPTSVTIGYKSVDYCSYGEREGE